MYKRSSIVSVRARGPRAHRARTQCIFRFCGTILKSFELFCRFVWLWVGIRKKVVSILLNVTRSKWNTSKLNFTKAAMRVAFYWYEAVTLVVNGMARMTRQLQRSTPKHFDDRRKSQKCKRTVRILLRRRLFSIYLRNYDVHGIDWFNHGKRVSESCMNYITIEYQNSEVAYSTRVYSKSESDSEGIAYGTVRFRITITVQNLRYEPCTAQI